MLEILTGISFMLSEIFHGGMVALRTKHKFIVHAQMQGRRVECLSLHKIAQHHPKARTRDGSVVKVGVTLVGCRYFVFLGTKRMQCLRFWWLIVIWFSLVGLA